MPSKTLGMRFGRLQRKIPGTTMRVSTAHCRGGVRSIFGFTLHKDGSTNQYEKCNKFHCSAWETHALFVRPIVVREKSRSRSQKRIF